jgi:hypothetical protein
MDVQESQHCDMPAVWNFDFLAILQILNLKYKKNQNKIGKVDDLNIAPLYNNTETNKNKILQFLQEEIIQMWDIKVNVIILKFIFTSIWNLIH